MSFTVVSTFSGCGGSSLGYRLAGGKILLAADFDKHAVETYKANFPDTPLFHGDVTNLSVEKIFEITGLKVGELDIFDGSPPCQGFSTTGKRDMTDDRNQLFKQFCRILQGLKPKCFVMENVSGMIKGNMKFVFVEILKTLKECGYQVKAKLLNAKNFNVPQSRQRMIFIGVRNDLEIEPSHPSGSTKLITVKECFKDCVEGKRFPPENGWIKQNIHLIKPGESGGKHHPKGHYFSVNRLEWDKPSPTICKQFRPGRSMILHPEKDLSLSIEELKRLSSFPDDFIFTGPFREKWARMGNCVPPNFMRAIAEHINLNILSRVKDCDSSIYNATS